MNPVLILAHNGLELTKKCVESLFAQDVPVEPWLFDNGSTDGSYEWMQTELPKGTPIVHNPYNLGVSFGWNYGIEKILECNDHVFVINNDTAMPPWFCSTLLSYDGPFISGVSVGRMEDISSPPPRKELAPCPDFSAWLMRRECWDKVGRFDPSMVMYASDLDYHLRSHRLGVRLMNAGVPFYHERSSTLRLSSPKERRLIEMQADADRMTFYEKWRIQTWSPEYAAQFTPENFGIDAK